VNKKTSSQAEKIARRRFMLGVGGALTLPLLPSLLGESKSHASPVANASPKRFIFVFTANGQKPRNWYPTTPRRWTTLSATQHVREASLAGTGGISRVLGPELDRFRSKLLLLRGLDLISPIGRGHCVSGPLSAQRVNPAVTIDQVLAYSSKVYPLGPPVRSINLLIKDSFQASPAASYTDVGGSLQPVMSETHPSVAFARLFGTFAATQDPRDQAREALRFSVMERIRSDYDTVRQSSRLGSEDRKRLTAHVEHLADLEARIKAGRTGRACARPDAPQDLDDAVTTNLPALTTMNIDLLVAAIKCDRTRVATLQLCPGTDLRTFAFLPEGPFDNHHNLSHTPPEYANEKLAIVNHWYAKQFADLLAKLDVIEDPVTNTTYLDNTIIYWGNEDTCSDGDTHNRLGFPALLAGGTWYFKTGRYVDYRHVSGTGDEEIGERALYGDPSNPTQQPVGWPIVGRPYHSLLISIMAAMGLAPEDYERDGNKGFGDYSGNVYGQYSIADGQKPLPFLAV
jgi:hypothetical protein